MNRESVFKLILSTALAITALLFSKHLITEVYAGQQEYTTGSGNFTATVTGNHTITLVGGGGGGGGGGASNKNGGGGGGGGALCQITVSLTLGNNYAYSVGTAGSAGAGDGGTGGSSTFTVVSTYTAGGGGGGLDYNNGGTGGSPGGTGAGCTLSYIGGLGALGTSTYSGGGGSGAGTSGDGNPGTTSTGGAAVTNYGGKGGNGSTANSGNGVAGEAYGGGGGGATKTGSAAAGYTGYIIITWTDPSPTPTVTPTPAPTSTPTPAGITISGNIYQASSEGTAFDCSSGGPYTVNLRVNGAGTYSGNCNLNTGAWEVTNVAVTSGQTIYAYLFNETPKGSTVLVSDNTQQIDVPIYVDRITLRDDVNGSITNTEISAGNTADADDLISFTGSDLTVASTYETHIYTLDTYAPGANVSTGKLHVVGNYTGSTETLTLTGSGTSTSRPLYVNGGTFTAPATTVFQGTAASSIEATTFNALTLNPTISAGIAYTFLGAETINGNFYVNPTSSNSSALTVNLGGTTTVGPAYTTSLLGTTTGTSTLDTISGSNHSFSTGLLYVYSAGTLTANNSAISLTGTSGTLFTKVGGFTSGNSTVTAGNASGTPTLNSGTISFYNLTIDPTASTTINTSTDAITVTNTLNVAANDILSLASGQNLTHSGATLTLDGTISGAGTYIYQSATAFPTTGTISSGLRMDATANDQILAGSRTYGGNVEIYNNSGTNARVVTMGNGATQTLTFSGNITLNAANTQSVSLTASGTFNPAITISTGNLAGTAGNGTENITTGTGIWLTGGSVDLTNIGTFTTTGGTFQMNGSSKTITSTSKTFNNFSVTGGSVSNVDDLDVDGNFALTSGTFTHGAGATVDVYVAGNFTLSGSTTWTKNTDGGKLIFNGATTYTDSNVTKQDVGDVQIGNSPGTTNLATDFSANSLTVVAGDVFNTCEYDLDIGNGGITLNTGAPGGILDASPTGTTVTCTANEADETIINNANSLTFNSGASFVQDGSTIIMDDTAGTDVIITDGSFSLNNLTIAAGAAVIIQVQDALDVNNNLTITTGTLDTVSGENNQINVGGNWDNDAAFEARSGTVVFDSTTGGKTIDADGTGTDNFYTLTFDDNSSAGAWSFGADAAIVTNTMTITGGAVTAPSSTLTIGNDFTNNDSFSHGSGTIIFNDIAQTSILIYSAATTFNNFTVATAGKAMQFDNVDQTNVAGLFSIQGTDCTTGRIFLDSDVNNSPWEIYVSGTQNIDYADVEDSTAVTTALTADNSTADNDSNTNWTINAGVCGGATATPTLTPTPAPTNTPTITPTPDASAHSTRVKGNTDIRGGVRIK